MENELIQPQEPSDPMNDKLQTFFTNVKNLQDNYSNFKRTVNKPIVFITSGGTSVPLEANTVRSVENFSTGTRGSRSAEYFLKGGHPVIFFYRKDSIQPFSIEIQSKRDTWMTSYSVNGDNTQFNKWIKEYQKYHSPTSPSSKMLIKIPFVTIHEYLDGIEKISRALHEYNLSSISYMASAVSDFWIPLEKMEQHKIQSKDIGEEGYTLLMDNTPRMLGDVKHKWNPNTILVSFKLETDMNILEQKALGAMDKYKVDMVVANQLQTRRTQVCIYQTDGSHQLLEVPEPHFQDDQISQVIVKHIQERLGIYEELDEEMIQDKSETPQQNNKRNNDNEMKNELYVTNIDFKTHQDDLKKHFEQIGQVIKCKIIYQNGRSKGKAFIEYLDAETASRAITELNGKVFEGRELNVEIQGLYDFVVKKTQAPYNERRGYEPRESRERYQNRHHENDRDHRRNDRNGGFRSRSDKEARYHKEKSNTLYVGNLSYDTTEEVIEKAFEEYGKVQDVRISYNHSGSSKGFAYVEFCSERDASKAFNETIEIDGREVRLDYDTKGTRGGYSKFHHRGQESDNRRESSPRYHRGREGRDDSYDRPKGIYRGGEEYEQRYR